MKHVLIIHEVEDYTAWKKVFDTASGLRKAAGEISYRVFIYDDEPNKVVHLSAWNNRGDAKQFFNSAQLIRIRARAGVKSLEFIYLNLLEAGVL